MNERLVEKIDAEEKDMSFIDHLEELRWHIIRSIASMFVFAILTFIFSRFIFDYIILAPKSDNFFTYQAFCGLSTWLGLGKVMCMTPSAFEIINFEMAGQFLTDLKISVILGFIISFPYIFWEIWRFIAPGLYENERSATRGLVFYASALFITGILFGYFVLTPFSINFFVSYEVSSQVNNTIALASYISLLSTIVLASGIMFELPMVVYLLSKIGIVTPSMMRTYRKHAIVVIIIIAAIITPADVWTQVLVSIPVYFLYELSIFISAAVQPKNSNEVIAP